MAAMRRRWPPPSGPWPGPKRRRGARGPQPCADLQRPPCRRDRRDRDGDTAEPELPISDRIVAGLAFLLNDEPERAIEMLERARAEAPNVDDTHAMLTAAYARAGRMDAARRAAAEAVDSAPTCASSFIA